MARKRNDMIARTVCVLNDGIRCGLSVLVSDGVIQKVVPADYPNSIDRGACAKGLATYQLVYHPSRLRYPLERTGGRGEGKWKRVSWDEALDGIADKLRGIIERYGGSAVAWGAPDDGSLTGGGYSRLASLTNGTGITWWSMGDSAAPCADFVTFGWQMGETFLSRVSEPKYSIIWGYNPAVTEYTRMRRIVETKKKGCKLVAIDPRYTATAAHADEYIAIRPGTDGALALAMMYVIFQNGLQDEMFIEKETNGAFLVRRDNGMFLRESDVADGGSQKSYVIWDKNSGRPQSYATLGVMPSMIGKYSVSGIECSPAFQLLLDMVGDYPPDKVSRITDVPADVIRRMAIDYATQKPASIHRGWGLQRSFYADIACRAINTLAMITGNITLQRRSSFVLNWQPFLMPRGTYHKIPAFLLYDAISKGDPLPIKAVWYAGHNFFNQLPNMNRVVSEILPKLELIVVSDFFMTATARYADYVLPAATFYECIDLRVTTAQNMYLAFQPKVVEPLYESKSDFRIAAELARKMGFSDYFDKTEEQYIEEILASGHPTMEGISLAKLKEGPVAAKAGDRPKQFKTPSGRIEFYVENLKRFGQELPIYLAPIESGCGDKIREYPLTFLSTHFRHRVHSTMANVESLLRLEPEPVLEINPADAGIRNINDGDIVRVFNDRGEVEVKARISSRIKSGVVNIVQGWWPDHYISGHHNQLTHDKVNEVQKFIWEPNAAYYDVLVEVRKAD